MATDKHYLDLAARLALRGQGDVEPNPIVGAVLVRNDRIVGMGHHRRFGGPHAEAEALEDCRRRSESAGGATMYVTLEPCNHAGKQPPCSLALIQAGVARVVIARADPNPDAQGGAETLRGAGIAVEFSGASPLAASLAGPFVKRTTTGLPWVIAKWAQTIDGRIATRTGESQWISGPTSRRRVHRLRARVDAVLSAIGTVRTDNPRLTARGVPRVRRIARRIIIDPRAELPLDSALVQTISDAPLTVVFDQSVVQSRAEALAALASRGVELLPAPSADGRLDLRRTLAHLAAAHHITNILVEAGPRLLGSLLAADLVDEAHVYIAPLLLADEQAIPAACGTAAPSLSDGRRFLLLANRRVGEDAFLVFGRRQP